MSHHDRDRSRPENLSDILGTLANSAAETHAGRTPETLLATARRHGAAARRRQTRSRALVAAASVAAIAVGGVVIAQNLDGTAVAPPPATRTTEPSDDPTIEPGAAFPECGAPISEPDHLTTLRLVTDAVPDSDGKPSSTSPQGASPFITQSIDDLFDVAISNQGDSTATVGSTGYAAYVLTRDGVVVGATDAMPEPFREDTLAAGDVSENLSRAGIAMCDGPEAEVAGTYAMYAYVDATLTDPDAGAGSDGSQNSTTRLWGGPWNVRIGSTVGGSATMALECGMPTSEITAPEFPQKNGKPVVISEITPPQGAVDVQDVMERKVRVDLSSADDSTYFGGDIEVYLVRGGKVVSTRATTSPGDPWYVGKPDTWASTVEETGATPAEAFFPEIAGVDCETGKPLADGEYEMLIVTRMWVPDYQFTVFAPRERLTLGDAPALPGTDPLAIFPECGAAVPGFSDTALVVQDAAASPWRVEDATNTSGIAFDLALRNEGDGTAVGRVSSVFTVLTLDGRVVGEADLTTSKTRYDLTSQESVSLAAGFWPRGCATGSEVLPVGTYDVWALVETVPEGGKLITSIGRVGSVTFS